MVWIYISLGFFLVAMFLFLFVPSRTKSSFFGGAKSPSDILKYIGTVCGAIIVVGTLYETAQSTKLNFEANKVANEANYLSRKAQLDNRFIQANNLLASKNSSENIAGIYALNQIAIDASKDSTQRGYIPVIKNVLCAYICENSDFRVIKDENVEEALLFRIIDSVTKTSRFHVEGGRMEGIITKPEIVFQTIINVLFVDEMYEIYKNYPTDLKNSVLSNLDLSKVHLEGADLEGAFFESAKFSSNTYLEGANLSYAHLEGVYFSDGTSFIFDEKKNLNDVSHLERVNLNGAYLSNANLNGLDLSGVDLCRADLSGAKLVQTNLEGADLSNANLNYTDFSETILDKRTNFEGTIHEGKSIENIKSYK